MANMNEQATHTKHANNPTYREDEYIALDLKLDELAFASGQGAKPLPNVKQELFCNEYMVDFNITQAAIRAGYSPNGAGQTGNKLLKQAKIGDRIRYLYRKRMQRIQAKGDDVVRELQAIAFSDITDYVNIDKRGNIKLKDLAKMENTKAIKSMSTSGRSKTVKITLHDKVEALEKLMRHLGLDNPVELIIRMKKLEIDMLRAGVSEVTKVDDGFMDAMNETSDDVMFEFEAQLERQTTTQEETDNTLDAPTKPEFKVRHNIVGGNL